mmetsp:Transcript_82081/g.150417  ORF Transcript_82081/g.150417 Transcript_82081/m.150417 type:complete len:212 (-) Transcript_82081:624-1259(-)
MAVDQRGLRAFHSRISAEAHVGVDQLMQTTDVLLGTGRVKIDVEGPIFSYQHWQPCNEEFELVCHLIACGVVEKFHGLRTRQLVGSASIVLAPAPHHISSAVTFKIRIANGDHIFPCLPLVLGIASGTLCMDSCSFYPCPICQTLFITRKLFPVILRIRTALRFIFPRIHNGYLQPLQSFCKTWCEITHAVLYPRSLGQGYNNNMSRKLTR